MATIEELRKLGSQIDIKIISAKKMTGRGGLYERMHRLSPNREWATLRGPVWVDDNLVMILIKPRDDDAAYNNKAYPGECTNTYRKL